MDPTSVYSAPFLNIDSSVHRLFLSLLEKADIQINGERPWDMQLCCQGVPEQALSRGNLGLGEV